MMGISIPFMLIDDSASIPAYAHQGDAAVDLRASCAGTIEPGERMLIPCGFALAIPEGYAGLILPRSGLALRNGVTVLNAPGLIDSGYRGEIKVCLINTDRTTSFTFSKGDRIAQLFVIPTTSVQFQPAEELTESERGIGGFGSTGRS